MPSSSTLARRRRRRRRKRAKEMEKILVVSSSMYLIPEHIQININEAFVLISILYDVGFLFDLIEWFNLDDDDERKDGLEVFNFEDQVKLDTNWSIIRLDLGDSSWGGGKQYCLPSTIGRLQKLKSITLNNCTVVAKELGSLTSLITLNLCYCPQEFFDNIPEEFSLSSILLLQIRSGNKFGSLFKLFRLFSDSLDYISYSMIDEREQIEEFFRILQDKTQSGAFRNSLTELTVDGCGLNESDLERIIFEILPLYPNIWNLSFNFNDVKSLRPILDRIDRLEQEHEMPSSSSSSNSAMAIMPEEYRLSRLDLCCNPVWTQYDAFRDEREKDPSEKDALLTLLGKFNRISNIGYEDYDIVMDKEIAIDPDIEYILRINHAGRKYLTTVDGGTIARKPINCSLWSIIFERAYQKSLEVYSDGCGMTDKQKKKARCATGLFHLIRNMHVYQWRGEKVFSLAPSSNVYIQYTVSSSLMMSSVISKNNDNMPTRTMDRLTTNNTGPNSSVYGSDNNGSSKHTHSFRGASLLTEMSV